MEMADKKLPDNVESLKNIVVELHIESGHHQIKISDQQTQLAEQQSKIEHQANYINQLIEGIKLARDQRFGSSSEKQVKPRKKGGRRSLPDHLPRVEVVHQLDNEACEVCGITKALMPTQPIRGSIASAGTLTHVVADKYVKNNSSNVNKYP